MLPAKPSCDSRLYKKNTKLESKAKTNSRRIAKNRVCRCWFKWLACGLCEQNKGKDIQYRQDKTRQDKARHDTTRHDTTRQDKTRQDKTRQDKTRQDKTKQDKARQQHKITQRQDITKTRQHKE